MNPNSDNEHYDHMQIINMNFAIKRGQSENAFSALPSVSKMGVAKARIYDPIMGQFISVDPLADKYPGIGPYVYCLNNPLIYWDPNGEDWFHYLEEGKDDYAWHYQEGTEHTFTDENGEEQIITGFEYMVEFNYSGEINEDGSSVGSITIYKQDEVVLTQDGVFSGSSDYSGTEPADKGTYFMSMGNRDSDGPNKMNESVDGPAPFWGAQKIPNKSIVEVDGKKYSTSFTSDWGNSRVRLQPSTEVRSQNLKNYGSQRQERGLYLHGKGAKKNWTHGCVCDKSENAFNYLWNNVNKTTPFVIK